jgi:hypothetical protein
MIENRITPDCSIGQGFQLFIGTVRLPLQTVCVFAALPNQYPTYFLKFGPGLAVQRISGEIIIIN